MHMQCEQHFISNPHWRLKISSRKATPDRALSNIPKMPAPPSDLKDQAPPEISGQLAQGASRKALQPLQPLQTAAVHSTTTGISKDTAQTAHDFMSSTTRRMSDAQSPHSPGLTDELMQQTHVFWDSTATRRKSHSKHLPDVTLPGMTDQVVQGMVEFVETAEGKSSKND
jgi:hypothetical protein